MPKRLLKPEPLKLHLSPEAVTAEPQTEAPNAQVQALRNVAIRNPSQARADHIKSRSGGNWSPIGSWADQGIPFPNPARFIWNIPRNTGEAYAGMKALFTDPEVQAALKQMGLEFWEGEPEDVKPAEQDESGQLNTTVFDSEGKELEGWAWEERIEAGGGIKDSGILPSERKPGIHLKRRGNTVARQMWDAYLNEMFGTKEGRPYISFMSYIEEKPVDATADFLGLALTLASGGTATAAAIAARTGMSLSRAKTIASISSKVNRVAKSKTVQKTATAADLLSADPFAAVFEMPKVIKWAKQRGDKRFIQDLLDTVDEFISNKTSTDPSSVEDMVMSSHGIGDEMGNNLTNLQNKLNAARAEAELPITTSHEEQLQELGRLKDEDLIKLSEDLKNALEDIGEDTGGDVAGIQSRAGERKRGIEGIRDKGVLDLKSGTEKDILGSEREISGIQRGSEKATSQIGVDTRAETSAITRDTKANTDETNAILKRRAQGGGPVTPGEMDVMAREVNNLVAEITQHKEKAIREGKDVGEVPGLETPPKGTLKGLSDSLQSQRSGDALNSTGIKEFMDSLPEDKHNPVFGYLRGRPTPNVDTTRPQTPDDFGIVLTNNRRKIWEQLIEKSRYIDGLLHIHKNKKTYEWAFNPEGGSKEVGGIGELPQPITLVEGGTYAFANLSDRDEIRKMVSRYDMNTLKQMQDQIRELTDDLQREPIEVAIRENSATPEKIIEEVVKKPQIGSARLRQILAGKVQGDKPLTFDQNTEQWLNAGLDAEIPRVMQIAYLEEVLKQAGLTESVGKIDYGNITKVMESALTPDKLNLLDPDLQEILKRVESTITDPAGVYSAQDLATRVREVGEMGGEAKRLAETRGVTDIAETKRLADTSVHDIKDDVASKKRLSQASQSEINKRADNLIATLDERGRQARTKTPS